MSLHFNVIKKKNCDYYPSLLFFSLLFSDSKSLLIWNTEDGFLAMVHKSKVSLKEAHSILYDTFC